MTYLYQLFVPVVQDMLKLGLDGVESQKNKLRISTIL